MYCTGGEKLEREFGDSKKLYLICDIVISWLSWTKTVKGFQAIKQKLKAKKDKRIDNQAKGTKRKKTT